MQYTSAKMTALAGYLHYFSHCEERSDVAIHTSPDNQTIISKNTPLDCRAAKVARNNSVALLIPAYNEEKTIVSVVTHCLTFISDVFVVNDGSTDTTRELVQALPVTLIDHEANRGKSESLVNGIEIIKKQGFSHVISIDADGQHDPSDIPRLLNAIETCPDHIIIAARLRKTARAPRSRLIANRVADFFISWAAGQKVLDSQSGFRVYPTSLCHLMAHYKLSKTFVFESELLIKASIEKTPITAIAIDSCYPINARASYFHPCRDIFNLTRMVAYYLVRSYFNLAGLRKISLSKDHLLDL
jgi:glycosyltransferase involved in cell wall biosynthesis